VLAIFAVTVMLANTVKPLYNLPKGQLDREKIPLSFDGWQGQNLSVDKTTRQLLNKGDLMSRVYTDTDGRQVQVFMDASVDTMAFHDPHLCLPGGGSPITGDQAITIKFTEPRPITVKATLLQATGDYGTSLLIYWYMLGNKSYPKTGDVSVANRWNKKQDFVNLLAKPWSTEQLRKEIVSRQFVWYRFSTEAYGDGSDREFLEKFIRQYVANLGNFGQ
jgi:EpsI family protein